MSRSRRLAVPVAAGLALVVFALTAGVGSARTTVAPSNQTPPQISGKAQVGQVLTSDNGTWGGTTPLTYSYQWRTCNENGGSCQNISGATASTYTVVSGDSGNALRSEVTAKNSDGSDTSTSVPTAAVTTVLATVAPTNRTPPQITGKVQAGQVLTTDNGNWNGTMPLAYAYQWLACNGNGNGCQAIAGATGNQHAIQPKDPGGGTLRVRVTATNSSGSQSSTSIPTAAIMTATVAAPSTGCPALASGATSVAIGGVLSPARLQIDQMQSTPRVITRSTGLITVRLHITDTCGTAVQGATVYATGTPYNMVSIPAQQLTDSSGWVSMQFRTMSGFPATARQRLLVMFVRASKQGDPALAGISTRRLISLHVNLNH